MRQTAQIAEQVAKKPDWGRENGRKCAMDGKLRGFVSSWQ
jgi:hypothetical protein